MNSITNKIIVAFYWLFMFIPFPYMLGSSISYYSVKREFGTVLDSYTLFELLRTGSRKVFILPYELGEAFLLVFFWSILALPFFLLVNYILKKKVAGVKFQGRFAIALVAVYLISFILIFRTDPFGGWYLSLIAD